MNTDRSDCGTCEAEALLRVMAVRDLLDLVIWNQTDPLKGVESAISGLNLSRNQLRAARWESDS